MISILMLFHVLKNTETYKWIVSASVILRKDKTKKKKKNSLSSLEAKELKCSSLHETLDGATTQVSNLFCFCYNDGFVNKQDKESSVSERSHRAFAYMHINYSYICLLVYLFVFCFVLTTKQKTNKQTSKQMLVKQL